MGMQNKSATRALQNMPSARKELTDKGMKWEVRHIYREYNQAADALSNEAIDEPERRWTTAGW